MADSCSRESARVNPFKRVSPENGSREIQFSGDPAEENHRRDQVRGFGGLRILPPPAEVG